MISIVFSNGAIINYCLFPFSFYTKAVVNSCCNVNMSITETLCMFDMHILFSKRAFILSEVVSTVYTINENMKIKTENA